MDLEVDTRRRDAEEKITDSSTSDSNEKIHDPRWQTGFAVEPANPVIQPRRDGASLRVVVLRFSIVLAAAVALAAIAAGVAGSIAVRRQKQLNHCTEANDALLNQLNANHSTAAPLSQCTNITNATNSSVVGNKPQSECTTLPSFFSSAEGPQYDLHCGIDLRTVALGEQDLLGVYVYTFTDCINTCSSFNTWVGRQRNVTCYAVSYNLPLSSDVGNCWLKAYQKIPFTRNESVDSAVLLLS